MSVITYLVPGLQKYFLLPCILLPGISYFLEILCLTPFSFRLFVEFAWYHFASRGEHFLELSKKYFSPRYLSWAPAFRSPTCHFERGFYFISSASDDAACNLKKCLDLLVHKISVSLKKFGSGKGQFKEYSTPEIEISYSLAPIRVTNGPFVFNWLLSTSQTSMNAWQSKLAVTSPTQYVWTDPVILHVSVNLATQPLTLDARDPVRFSYRFLYFFV